MEVKAIIKLNGEPHDESPLQFISTNLFEATLNIEKEGQYEVIVYAYDSTSGNTGVDKVNYIIYK